MVGGAGGSGSFLVVGDKVPKCTAAPDYTSCNWWSESQKCVSILVARVGGVYIGNIQGSSSLKICQFGLLAYL